MALINCKECGKEISDGAIACPHCGAKINTSEGLKLLGLLAIMFIIYMILSTILSYQ
jgi:RNA polymerase subunit RPABC4/transcription elongation factor Spt4